MGHGSGSLTASVPVALERRLLELVEKGGGVASWHWLAIRLPAPGVPMQPDMMVALRALRARGFVDRREAGAGSDAWSMTRTGRARLAALGGRGEAGVIEPGVEGATPARDGSERSEPRDDATFGSPLDQGALDALLVALRGPAPGAIRALIPLAGDGTRMRGALRQVLRADAALAPRVGFATAILPPEHRADHARELLADERPEIRAALLRAWVGERTDIPGQAPPVLAPDDLDELLRRGLADGVDRVRSAATALAFAADRGHVLAAELLALVHQPCGEPRRGALLALGSARDPASLAALGGALHGHEPRAAATAARALAARPDGHALWLRALDDVRPDVHQAAVFALAEVVHDVSADRLATLSRDGRPAVQAALAAYRARTSKTDERERS